MSTKNGSHLANRRRNTAGKTHMLPPLNSTSNTNNQLVSTFKDTNYVTGIKYFLHLLSCNKENKFLLSLLGCFIN